MAREAIAMVASGATPRVVIAGIRHGDEILDSARRIAPRVGRARQSAQADGSRRSRSGGRTDLRMTASPPGANRQHLTGRLPGNRRVRVARPASLYFRYAGKSDLGRSPGRVHSARQVQRARSRERGEPCSAGRSRRTRRPRSG